MGYWAFLLVWAAPVTVPAETGTADEEIVVTAQRFATWRGKARRGKAGWVCKTTQKSGSTAVDSKSCAILIDCIAAEEALSADGAPFLRGKHKPSQAQLDTVGQCVKVRRDEAIRLMAQQRR